MAWCFSQALARANQASRHNKESLLNAGDTAACAPMERGGAREGGGDGEVLQTAMFFMALNAGMDTFRIML